MPFMKEEQVREDFEFEDYEEEDEFEDFDDDEFEQSNESLEEEELDFEELHQEEELDELSKEFVLALIDKVMQFMTLLVGRDNCSSCSSVWKI
jgi:hypothetical protein